MGPMILVGLVLLARLIFASPSIAREVPDLKDTINDFAGMMSQASIHDLEERLNRFKARTGHTIAVLTVHTLEGEDME
ncbi:MAG: TPM domain-containing protein, partial [Deltaproteobacteria bacterium]|nr:TPM domain-containing protein [Deltaproteobacteria bacterium]